MKTLLMVVLLAGCCGPGCGPAPEVVEVSPTATLKCYSGGALIYEGTVIQIDRLESYSDVWRVRETSGRTARITADCVAIAEAP